jgi:hypothetical protein
MVTFVEIYILVVYRALKQDDMSAGPSLAYRWLKSSLFVHQKHPYKDDLH